MPLIALSTVTFVYLASAAPIWHRGQLQTYLQPLLALRVETSRSARTVLQLKRVALSDAGLVNPTPHISGQRDHFLESFLISSIKIVWR